MSYDALTIDTQPVVANGLVLDCGILAGLARELPVDFVLSEVVLREINKALIEKYTKPCDGLKRALRDVQRTVALDDSALATANLLQSQLPVAETLAEQDLEKFAAATQAIVVPAAHADLDALVKAYFDRAPPFSVKGGKYEFPDAIALFSLEQWAKRNDKRVLAVSRDAGWWEFAVGSDHTDVESDIPHALSVLNTHAQELHTSALHFLSDLAANQKLKETLSAHLSDSLDRELFDIELESAVPASHDDETVTFLDCEIPGASDGTTDVDIIAIRKNGFVLRAPTLYSVSVHVTFEVYDSIDKEYVRLGETFIEHERNLEGFSLIECYGISTGQEDDTPREFGVVNAEVLQMPRSIDIGYVDFDD